MISFIIKYKILNKYLLKRLTCAPRQTRQPNYIKGRHCLSEYRWKGKVDRTNILFFAELVTTVTISLN